VDFFSPPFDTTDGKSPEGDRIMPLKKGKSRETVSKNIEEFHDSDTYNRTKAKSGKKKADKQAVAVALSKARESGARIPKKKAAKKTVKKTAKKTAKKAVKKSAKKSAKKAVKKTARKAVKKTRK
jgi:hypothetical protein